MSNVPDWLIQLGLIWAYGGFSFWRGYRMRAGMPQTNPPWENDSIQFPRLISEIISVGLTESQWDDLLLSMDLESSDLSELFDRAQAAWDAHIDSLPMGT